MDRAREAAHAGDASRLWIVADAQTGGRGREGRRWTSPPGNLYASCLLVDVCGPERAPELGFAAGVALIAALGATPRLALKWPNDVLHDGAKLAGLLVEGFFAERAFCCTVGFGVNCQSFPTDLPYAATSLRAAGLPDDPADVLRRLSDSFAQGLHAWQTSGFGPVRDKWLAHAAHLGREVAINVGAVRHSGRFTTIDAAGRMILTKGATTHVVAAGDVFPVVGREPAANLTQSSYG